MLDGKTILITGGTGSFGQKFVQMTLKQYSPKKIIIFSRDELKQYSMMKRVSPQKYPIRYFLGDVRDLQRLRRAMQGVEYVVHAAAYKHVPAAEYNPFEFVKTNILGAQNVIEAALDMGVNRIIALSTDKACNPINLYGATKLAADKVFTAANYYAGMHDTRFAVVRYGNVVGSRGSVIPLFLNEAKRGIIPITDPQMTRFWITKSNAVKMVWKALTISKGGELYIPKIPTMGIMDLAEVVAPGVPTKVIGIRPGEKLHEVMISEDDSRFAFDFGTYYAILPIVHDWHDQNYKSDIAKRVPLGFRYSSDLNESRLSREQLGELLKNYIHVGHELIEREDISFYEGTDDTTENALTPLRKVG